MKRTRSPSSSSSPPSSGGRNPMRGLLDAMLLHAATRPARARSPAQRRAQEELAFFKRCVSRKQGASARQRVASMEDHLERTRTSDSEWPIHVASGRAPENLKEATPEQRERAKTALLAHLAACCRLARAVLDAPDVETALARIHDDADVGPHMREKERRCGQPLHRYGHKLVVYALRHVAERALYERVANLPASSPPAIRAQAGDGGDAKEPTDF